MLIALMLVQILITITKPNCALEILTKQGAIQGRTWTSVRGKEFLGYTGIPYAKPPVGELRFKEAVPAESWSGILNATKPHSPCPQAKYFADDFSPLGNEDCLYLNVYKPKIGQNYPVMFYVHGGSFYIGSGADDWIGPEILLDRDVVLVVVNYRLGALGFLSAEDEELPGNNGLKDQVLALRWVKENIQAFGGDPTNITVFGNSAGAMSVHYLTLSPLTKDLMGKVMIQSGSVTGVFGSGGIKGAAKENAEKLGKVFGCPTSSTRQLIACLQKVDVFDILQQEASLSDSDGALSLFQPVIEIPHPGAFISEDPIQIVKSKKFANIPIVIGIAANEGAYRAAELSKQPGKLNEINTNFTNFFSESFPISEDPTNTANEARQFYFGNKTIDNSTKLELSNLFSDGWFVSSLDVTLHLYLKHKFDNQSIYLYLFGHRGSTSYCELYGDLSFDSGVCHTDELLYLLPRHHDFPKYNPTAEDLNMADVLTKLWVDFATTGTPTPDLKTWQPLQDNKLQYFHIRSQTDYSMEEELFTNRRKFWKENVYQSIWKSIT